MDKKYIAVKRYSEFNLPLKVSFKGLFKGFLKIIGGVAAKSPSSAVDGAWDVFDAIDFKEDHEIGFRAYRLIGTAIRNAAYRLLEDHWPEIQDSIPRDKFPDWDRVIMVEVLDSLEDKFNEAEEKEFHIKASFFQQPEHLEIVGEIRALIEIWLEKLGAQKKVIVGLRGEFFPLFVAELNSVWSTNATYYGPLKAVFDEVFDVEKALGRFMYNQSLIEKWTEPIFDEKFGVDALYVELNACYKLPESKEDDTPTHKVVKSETYIWEWLQKPKSEIVSPILVLRGGPGSGKSSLMKRIAMQLAGEYGRPIYFIPLQWFSFDKGFEGGIRRFIELNDQLEGVENPFDLKNEGNACKPVFIFDGLDELSRTGEFGQSIATEFINQMNALVRDFRQKANWDLRIILTGRDFVIQQTAERVVGQPEQVLELLPYWLQRDEMGEINDLDWWGYHFIDRQGALEEDLRNVFWKNYWRARGNKKRTLMPKEIRQEHYESLNAQPLLAYLLARAYSEKLLQDEASQNINVVYERLICNLIDRPWGGKEGHKHIQMEKGDFLQLLEEMATVAWFEGDVRTVNLKKFEDRCNALELDILVKSIRSTEDARVGDLVVAFFAKGKGKDEMGQELAEFTHKSFGEYLIARKLVRAAMEMVEELDRKKKYKIENAVEEWVSLAGENEITRYMVPFWERETQLKIEDSETAIRFQNWFAEIFSHIIREGFSMENTHNSLDLIRATRNAESAALIFLAIIAGITKTPTLINWRDASHPRRVLGRLILEGNEPVLRYGLKWLKFPKEAHFHDFNFNSANLCGAYLSGADLSGAYLSGAYLSKAYLSKANLSKANLSSAYLSGAYLSKANLSSASLSGADLPKADLPKADLSHADLSHANLLHADLSGANLSEAHLLNAALLHANLSGAHLLNATLPLSNLSGAYLSGAYLSGAYLSGASLSEANLSGADFSGADLSGADLSGADLSGADLSGADLSGAIFHQAKYWAIWINGEKLEGQAAHNYLISQGALNVPSPTKDDDPPF